MNMNINDKVKFKLTSHGLAIAEAALNISLTKYDLEHDLEGSYCWQMWQVMNVFGEHLYNGCRQVFVLNRIEISGKRA